MADNLVAWIDGQISSLQRQHDHPHAGRDARAQHSNDIEQFTQLRAAADLLARARAGCRAYTAFIDESDLDRLIIVGETDLLRELAKALGATP